MDTLGAMTFVTPAGALISTAVSNATRNNIDEAKKVLVVNGDNKKKQIYILNAATSVLEASFTLPRFNSVTFIKKSTHTVYGLNIADGSGITNATNLTFQKVHSNHAD
jgi:hypothetical protein